MYGTPNYYPNLPPPPPFPAFEGIIQCMPNYYPNIFPPPLRELFIFYQRVKYLDLSERLDINCEFTVEPNHAICSNPAIEI